MSAPQTLYTPGFMGVCKIFLLQALLSGSCEHGVGGKNWRQIDV